MRSEGREHIPWLHFLASGFYSLSTPRIFRRKFSPARSPTRTAATDVASSATAAKGQRCYAQLFQGYGGEYFFRINM